MNQKENRTTSLEEKLPSEPMTAAVPKAADGGKHLLQDPSAPTRLSKLWNTPFWRAYFICAAVFVVICIATLSILYGWLVRFEADAQEKIKEEIAASEEEESRRLEEENRKLAELAADPEENVKNYLNALNKTGASLLFDSAAPALSVYESKAFLIDAIDAMRESDAFSYSADFSEEKSSYPFQILLDRSAIAAAVLLQDGVDETYGLKRWTVSDLQLFPNGTKEYTFCVPNGAAVTVNGVPLAEEHLTSSAPPASLAELENFFPVPAESVYTVSGLYLEPSVSASAKDGTSLPIEQKNNVFSVGYPAFEVSAEQENRFISIAKDYQRYVVGDIPFESLTPSLIYATPTYQMLGGLDTRWFFWHEKTEFTDISLRDAVFYSDTLCEVTIQYTATFYGYGRELQKETVTMRPVFRFADGTWKMASLVLQ